MNRFLVNSARSQILNMQMRNFGTFYPRKAKVKHMTYTQIPEWLEKQERDLFDYKLRSKEEVMEQHKYFPPQFQWNVETKKYPAGDVREHGKTRTDHRDKVCKITIDMSQLDLSPEQRERMIFLMGPRYNKNTPNTVKIVQKGFFTFEENYMRALTTFREIYWESLRAPDRCITFQRNPYRRQKLIKDMYGKTKEERKATFKLYNAQMIKHKEYREATLVEEQLKKDEKVSSRSNVKRQIARRRQKLGFEDNGAEEMSDQEMEHYDYVLDTVERKIIEESQRDPIEMPTDLRGIGIKDQFNINVRENEEFRDII